MYENKIGAYRKTNVVTADPKKLVVMCYDAAITNLKIARAKYLEKEYEAKANALEKAVNIISELMAALDFEKGGEIAPNLDALYRYMLRRLSEGDIKRDIAAFDEVILMLEDLGAAWKEIICGGRDMEEKPATQTQDRAGQKMAVERYA